MPRSGNAAIDVARQWLKPSNRPFGFRRMCLKITRTALGINARYMTAQSAWNNAKVKHRFNGNYNSVPRGVAFFWSGPSSAGHVVLTLGDGLCLTNDLKGPGTFVVAKLSTITNEWGAKPLGWTEDLNGVKYYSKPAPVKKAPITAVVVASAMRSNRPTAGQRASINKVKKALRARVGLDDTTKQGHWDSHARAAAKRWQKLLKHKQTGDLTAGELRRLGTSPKVPRSLRFKVK